MDEMESESMQNGHCCCVRDIKQMLGRVRINRCKKLFFHLTVKKYKHPTKLRTITNHYTNRVEGILEYENVLGYVDSKMFLRYNDEGE